MPSFTPHQTFVVLVQMNKLPEMSILTALKVVFHLKDHVDFRYDCSAPNALMNYLKVVVSPYLARLCQQSKFNFILGIRFSRKSVLLILETIHHLCEGMFLLRIRGTRGRFNV